MKSKSLEEMSLNELWDLFPIVLAEPSPEKWKEQFEREKRILYDILKDDATAIHHIGSTAVGTIKSKDIVDVIVETAPGKLKECAQRLREEGYIIMSESEERISLNKGYTANGYADEVFHIHLRKTGDADEIYFRDYLIRHPVAAKQYEILKIRLRREYGKDRDGYTAAKTDFVTEITTRAKKEL